MTLNQIWEYVFKNRNNFDKEIKVETSNYHWGDEYNSESGTEIKLTILGEEYSLGSGNVIEDRHDWGQAESYEITWCTKNDKHYKPDDLYQLLVDYKKISRDYKLSQIL
jgi:hypothetical protein